MQQLQNFLSSAAAQLLPLLIRILIAFVLFFAFYFLRKPLVRLMGRGMSRLLRRFSWAEAVSKSFERPANALLVCVGGYCAAVELGKGLGLAGAFLFLNAFLRISVIIAITWGLMNAASPIISAVQGSRTDLDRTLVAFFSKILQVVLLIIAGVIIIGETGYDISGMITGLGLTGLTFSLAAKDSASNLFGGLVIISDKPFGVGDWIQTPEMEGTVTDVTLRSTRIRTFKDAEVIIPNATLANTAIINWSRMSKRRVHFTLGVTYETSEEQLHAVVDGIRALLCSRVDEVEQESILVTFDAFGAYSLNLEVYYYAKCTSWAVYMQLKEAINFEIRTCLAEHGVKIAFPTQLLLHEENPPEQL